MAFQGYHRCLGAPPTISWTRHQPPRDAIFGMEKTSVFSFQISKISSVTTSYTKTSKKETLNLLLMAEIPFPTTWDGVWNPINNGKNYQPQLVQDFSHQQYVHLHFSWVLPCNSAQVDWNGIHPSLGSTSCITNPKRQMHHQLYWRKFHLFNCQVGGHQDPEQSGQWWAYICLAFKKKFKAKYSPKWWFN